MGNLGIRRTHGTKLFFGSHTKHGTDFGFNLPYIGGLYIYWNVSG
jgi:hypothetical protein